MNQRDFTADPEQLRRHAARLADHADRLAAHGTRLPDAIGEQSLGSFAGFITAGLGGAMAATQDAFGHVASAVDQVGDGVRKVADEYQRTDDDNSAGLTGIDAEASRW
jgi:uncharacterized protein YukE